MENCPKEDDDQAEEAIASAPSVDDIDIRVHKLEKLRMTEINAAGKGSQGDHHGEPKEWTVIYSDSNSSVLSEADEDVADEIDISIVEEGLLENGNEGDDDEEEEKEENESESDNENEENIDPEASKSKMTIFEEIDMGDPKTKFQVFEQSVDSMSGTWVKPFLIGHLVDGQMLSTPPSFADNEYESSDIDIIEPSDDEDEFAGDQLNDDRDSILSMSISSVISQTSNLSQLREQYLQAHLSKASGQKRKYRFFASEKDTTSNVPSDDDAPSTSNGNFYDSASTKRSGRIRAYVHTPNAMLNNKLTFVTILTVTAVLGLGIGHFIGWSDQWSQQKQLSMGQVHILKQLQDDLLVCMKHQNIKDDGSEYPQDHYQVCHRDFDYWKQRFETLFSENKGLIGLFQKTQKHFRDKGGDDQNVIEEHECVNKTTSEEFHKLKLNFLVGQMEYLKVIEVLEEVKNKGEQSMKRVKVLEEENLDLKKKLVEEEEDDQEINKHWSIHVEKLENENEQLRQTLVEDDAEDMRVLGAFKTRIDFISQENKELKSIIGQLEKQIASAMVERPTKHDKGTVESEFEENTSADYLTRYNALRDRINQMMFENEELKAKIARYRWTLHDKNEHGKVEPKRKYFKRRDDDDEMENDDDDGDDDVYEQKMAQLQAKIDMLNTKLRGEQIESRRWKERFESITKKMKKLQERKGRRDDARREKENGEREERNSKEGEKKESREKRKWNAFRAKLNQKLESFSLRSKKFFSNVYERMKGKWEKLHKRYSKEFASSKDDTPLNGDKLIQIGQFLESTLESVHNFSEKLFQKGMRSDVVTFLSDKMANFANILETNLNMNPNGQQWAKEKENRETKQNAGPTFATYQEAKYSERESSTEEFDDVYQEIRRFIPSENAHRKSSESVDRHEGAPPYPTLRKSTDTKKGDTGKQEDWLSERAKAREKFRRRRVSMNFMEN